MLDPASRRGEIGLPTRIAMFDRIQVMTSPTSASVALMSPSSGSLPRVSRTGLVPVMVVRSVGAAVLKCCRG